MSQNSPQRARAYGQWVVRWRWVLLITALIGALAVGSGGRFLAFNNDYRVFFSDENPQLQAFEALQRKYTKIDNVLFTLVPRDGDVFQPDVLAAVEQLTDEAWKLPFALRVDSVSNYQHTVALGDDLVVEDLVEGAGGYTRSELEKVREVATAEPALAGSLITGDGRATGVNVTFQMPEQSLTEVPEAVAAARALAAEIEAAHPVDVHLTGTVMLSNAFFESSMRDMATLVPLMYLVIIIVTFTLVRSVNATIGTVLVLLFSTVTAMGLAGLAGIKLTPPSSAAPTIIMTLAVADSIHILVSALDAMRRGLDRHAAIIESLRLNLQPVFLTSVTTAVGFLSMNFSDAPPFADLGNITAMGVMVAFLFSVTFLPAFLAVVPVRAVAGESRLSRQLDRFALFVTRRQRPILWTSVAVSLAVLAFVPRNELNDDFVNYFDESVEFRRDTDITHEKLTGIYQLQYSVPAGSSNGVSDPAFLAEVGAFVDWLRAQPEVRHVATITDTFKRLNKNLHGDDPAWYRLPEDRELAAQYLLLYELSLPYGLDLNNQLNVDKSSTQIIATLENLTSRALREVAQRGERWLEENTDSIRSIGVGPAIMFAYISERNINSMLVGTLAAVIVISFLIMVALRSLKIGALSLIPNLLPAGLAFGIWGALVGEVNVAISMVTGMTLGIVVDDTVHFLSKYLRARRERSLDAEGAVRYAFSHVGVPIAVTSFILVAGFLVLAQSSFAMNSYMAVLTAIAIAVALVADFLLLPALLLHVDRPSEPQALERPVRTREPVAQGAAG